MPINRLFYWDANIFLSYINGEPMKAPILEAILDEISLIIEVGGQPMVQDHDAPPTPVVQIYDALKS